MRPVLIFRRAVEDSSDPFVTATVPQDHERTFAQIVAIGADSRRSRRDRDDAVGFSHWWARFFRLGWCSAGGFAGGVRHLTGRAALVSRPDSVAVCHQRLGMGLQISIVREIRRRLCWLRWEWA